MALTHPIFPTGSEQYWFRAFLYTIEGSLPKPVSGSLVVAIIFALMTFSYKATFAFSVERRKVLADFVSGCAEDDDSMAVIAPRMMLNRIFFMLLKICD